jgi:hypothetical protein
VVRLKVRRSKRRKVKLFLRVGVVTDPKAVDFKFEKTKKKNQKKILRPTP